MEEACDDIHADACQGWIRHARHFFTRCLARENIADDVDEVLWPDQDRRWDAELFCNIYTVYFFQSAEHFFIALTNKYLYLCTDLSLSFSPFPPNKLWFLNRFRSGFLEPWCYLANQPAFPPVLSGTIVMKDASSTEGVAQCTLNLENDTPTDVITVRKENLLFFGSSWEPTFRVPNQFIFGRNAPNGSKLGARTGTEPVPCWWKRAISGDIV